MVRDRTPSRTVAPRCMYRATETRQSKTPMSRELRTSSTMILECQKHDPPACTSIVLLLHVDEPRRRISSNPPTSLERQRRHLLVPSRSQRAAGVRLHIPISMLGIYLQRSCIISVTTALIIIPIYIFTTPILKLLHQSDDISELSGKFARWVIPQIFAYAINFPLQKFLQSQSKVWVMTFISGVALGIHILLNWIFATKLGYGLFGAATAGNASWWLLNLAQIVYAISGFFPQAWTGFSMKAFGSLANFVKLSLASAIMLCLELWYFTAMIIMVGSLNNPEVQVDAISICTNYNLWALMFTLGFTAAISVRVSNELGANNPKAAKFSVIVAISTSALVGVIFMVVVLLSKTELPKFFTNVPEVISETSKLGYLLAVSVVINSLQPVLSGVAIGAGWQLLVAFVNIGCYYIVGLPIGAVLGFHFKLKAMGIWSGMLIGTALQTTILLFITFRTKWQNEATQAEKRIKAWGGQVELQPVP